MNTNFFTLNFCTLFNKNYITRGLAMHKTLTESDINVHLYVFAFDDDTYNLLTNLQLERATIISLKKFEDEKLLTAKSTRSFVEYCWTCTPSIILYSIEKYSLDHCTYVDSDLYFINSPRPLIEEIPASESVLLTEHRYTPEFDSTSTSGRFCVQFMTFKNTNDGITALSWWRERCIEWCYYKAEDGKFGDQGYLQDWETRFTGIHILQHLGGGLAPWNIQQYDFVIESDKLIGVEKKSGQKFVPVFYHFHFLRFHTNREIVLSNFPLTHLQKIFIYYPYVFLLEKMKFLLMEKFQLNFDPHGATEFIEPIAKQQPKVGLFKRAYYKAKSMTGK